MTPPDFAADATELSLRIRTDLGIALPPMAIKLIAMRLAQSYEDGKVAGQRLTGRTP